MVRFIRVVTVPEDGSCLLVFEATDSAAVEAVVRRALIDFTRVTPVFTVPESESSTSVVERP